MNTDITKLRDRIAEITNSIALLKAEQEKIQAALLAQYGHQFAQALADNGKQYGDITREVDGVKLTYSVKAKVKWDNDQLANIASSLPWEMTSKIFKIEFSVPERTFKAMTDQKLVDRLTDARTVEYSEPKISIA